MFFLLPMPNDLHITFPYIKTGFFAAMAVLAVYILCRDLLKQKKENRYYSRSEAKTTIEPLNRVNKNQLEIARGNIPVSYVAEVADTVAIAEYSATYGLPCLCYAIKYNEKYVGIILLEKAMPELARRAGVMDNACFRVYGFVIDGRYHSIGIGSTALQQALEHLYAQYGVVTVIAECHKDNTRAISFFEKNGFENTGLMDELGTNIFMVLR